MCDGLGWVPGQPRMHPLGYECQTMRRCPACAEARTKVRLARRTARISQECGLSGPQRAKRFENFETYAVDGRGNHDALRWSREFAANPGQTWLVMPGLPGTGKTHLLAAIGNELAARGIPVLYAYVPKLLNWLRDGYRHQQASLWGDVGGEDEDFQRRFRRVMEVEVLLLDDLGAQQDTPWVREQLETIFDHRYSNQLPLAVTTNDDPSRIRDLSERVYSRIMRYESTARVPLLAPPYHERARTPDGRGSRG